MQSWQILTIITPIFFVAYQALSKLLPKGTSILLVNAYAYGLGALIFIALHLTFTSRSITLPVRSLALALGIGALMAAGGYSIVKIFTLGAPQSGFAALYNPLYIVYGLLVGIIVWHEKLNAAQLGGVGLAIIGIIVIAYFRTA